MGKYRILEQHGLNYLTLTIVGWIDIFSRQRYRDIVIESLKYCQEHKVELMEPMGLIGPVM